METIVEEKPLDLTNSPPNAATQQQEQQPLSESVQALLDATRNSHQGGSSIMIDLQRIIKANHAMVISKMQAAFVAAATQQQRQIIHSPPLMSLMSSTPPLSPDTSIDSPTSMAEQQQPPVSIQKFQTFRENMLKQFAINKTKRWRCSSSPTSSSEASLLPSSEIGDKRKDEVKDATYWERRKKNNEAAKRSRDARRAKEDEIAIRAAFLEQENSQLKWEIAKMKAEIVRLKSLLLGNASK